MSLALVSTAAPTPIDRSRAVSGRRSDAVRVVLAVNDALAPCIEGQALIADVEAGIARITLAAVQGSRHAVVNEAHRLGARVEGYRGEFRRLAEAIEEPGDFDDAA